MFTKLKNTIEYDIKNLKRKYTILKIKWLLLFFLPIFLIVLSYEVLKELLKIKVKALGTKAGQDIKKHG